MAFDKQQKILALRAALAGDAAPLKALTENRGRRYSPEETEAQRLYISSWDGKPATTEDAIRFFGRYDKTGVPGQACYELPNGMLVFFS